MDALHALGWRPFFEKQMAENGRVDLTPVRVMDFYMREVEVCDGRRSWMIPLLGGTPTLAVGDWGLVHADGRVVDCLDRASVFRRKAAGTRVEEQVVAANVDTAFVVCSLNEDFNLNRIERYLSLVHESDAEPVVVLSKKDLCADTQAACERVRALDPELPVVAVDARERASLSELASWCGRGETVVLVGSSGSGKSTLTNTLMGEAVQDTGAIKASDGKGRHTTTRRSLVQMPGGALLLDTPGMRELQLMACEAGMANAFADIETLAEDCKFSDCGHRSEPGCAVKRAVEAGELSARRFRNYLKLGEEQKQNAAVLGRRHVSNRRGSREFQRSSAYARGKKGAGKG